MGKNKARKMATKVSKLPFVSVCTPTYNRRPFVSEMIRNFRNQDYPMSLLEWIIIDDGTDKIGDLVKDIPNVKYYAYDEKMPLGKKRNLMHEKSKGDILVYMDDDDYYPPCRVSHAVSMLQKHPTALCAGSSEIYIWFKHIQKMYQFGPYGPNHATAGTFAFKRVLLKDHAYEEHAALAEERAFLKNYTVPFVQLNPLKTILVFSHDHNTFDKRKLLDNPPHPTVKESTKTVDMFIRDKRVRKFYMEDIEELLKDYEPGRPEMKPDVLKQTKELEEERRQKMEQMMAQQNEKLMVHCPDGQVREVPPTEMKNIILNQQNDIKLLLQRVKELEEQLKNIEQMPTNIIDVSSVEISKELFT